VLNDSAAPVIAGLAVGISLVVLFSISFGQQYGTLNALERYHRGKPGRLADIAINIGLEDATVNKLFERRDIVATSVRDWELVSWPYCPTNWYAILLFDEN
jgi:hypothetical protein